MGRWANPQEWLMENIRDWDIQDLLFLTNHLISKIDPEEIYEVFQDEMEADGYFSQGGDE